jgi:WD40 repeat protein
MAPRTTLVPIDTINVSQIAKLRSLPHTEGDISSAAFSPDSSLLALGCYASNVELWRTNTGTLFGALPGWVGAEDVVFHPGGDAVIGVSGNHVRFSVWDVHSGALISDVQIPVGHQPGCAAITPSGSTVATGGFGGDVLFWNWNNGNPKPGLTLLAHQGSSNFVTSLAFSPDGLYMATGSLNGQLRLWRAGFDFQPELHAEVSGAGSAFPSVSFNKSSSVLAAAGWDGFLHLMNVSDGAVRGKLSEPPSAVNEEMFSCDFSPTGSLVVSTQSSTLNAGALLEFWDADSNTLLLAKPYPADEVLFSPDGKRLAVIPYRPGQIDVPELWGVTKTLLAPRPR